MKAKSSILTKEERDVLILAAITPNGQHLNNTEIAQRLGISVSKVKTLIHNACVKLVARNRYDAVNSATRRGEICVDELFSLDELVEIFSALHPDILRRIANLVRQGPKNGHLLEDEEIIRIERRQDTILTKSEQDILRLVGRGLTNKEIADTLFMSLGTVGTLIYRICTKLGACNRSEAFVLALKRREIGIDDMYSLNELLEYLAPLGAESIEKIAQLLSQKREQESILTGN